MKTTDSGSKLGDEFNAFLFAKVCDERHDMPLSVLSALARLDLDPWQEAAELARMPGETAAYRLSSLLGALPEVPSAQPERGTIAARLIALLPSGSNTTIPSRGDRVGAVGTPHFGFLAVMFLVLWGSMAISMVIGHEAPARASGAVAAASGSPPPLVPTPTPDR